MKKNNYWYIFLLVIIVGINSKIVAAPLPEYSFKEKYVSQYLNKMPWKSYKAHYVPGITTCFWLGGYNDCVKDTVRKGIVWERYIVNLLKKYIKRRDIVIDVDAYIGTITLAMSNLVGKILIDDCLALPK